MLVQIEILLKAKKRGFHLITAEVLSVLPNLPKNGLLHLFIQHTSAGLTINENADPSVRIDFETVFNKLIPENDPEYIHVFEGNDDMPAHLKASLLGSSISIPIVDGKLGLGTWQGIYLGEFRNNASERRLICTLYS
ncbi:MAG TPA: secondary thiamine-phosphate synthase [Bacteroidales bacterium]|nr:secondary thiamine-phosphate synthase [Bacteroidales bacterium]